MAEKNVRNLQLVSTVGFNGTVPNGLQFHPTMSLLLYPLGTVVVVHDLDSRVQSFLVGHSNNVSCLRISRSGRLVASGQMNHMGFLAETILWDMATRKRLGGHSLHKVRVVAIDFSPSEKFVASLGGQDDGTVIVYDVDKREPLCGLTASQGTAGTAACLTFSALSDRMFATGGDYTLRVWKLDEGNNKITPFNVTTGQVERRIRTVAFDAKDEFMYCGTTTGDVLKAKVNLGDTRGLDWDLGRLPLLHACLALSKRSANQKQPATFSLGVTSLALLGNGRLLVGSGAGIVTKVHETILQPSTRKAAKPLKTICEAALKEVKAETVMGAVTSIACRGRTAYVGTDSSQIYRLNVETFDMELLLTCHVSAATDVVFPSNNSELLATSSRDDVRVWHTSSGKELLRISVPNATCAAVLFASDGSAILTGWNDGKIRAFTPETGRLMYAIHDAHSRGVTALASSSDGSGLISGGGEGQVRLWSVSPHTQTLREVMKEHKGTISCIRVKSNESECVSSSTDGTCIIWDLRRFIRKQILFANTLFRGVVYHPSECQLVTVGTDRKIGYWETYDGALIRELEASPTDGINAVDITPKGDLLVTGGADALIKVWGYDDGVCKFVGVGHSNGVTQLRVSPDRQHIVSVGADGSMLRWELPGDYK